MDQDGMEKIRELLIWKPIFVCILYEKNIQNGISSLGGTRFLSKTSIVMSYSSLLVVIPFESLYILLHLSIKGIHLV